MPLEPPVTKATLPLKLFMAVDGSSMSCVCFDLIGRQQENRDLRLFADIQIVCETIVNLWNEVDLFVSVFI